MRLRVQVSLLLTSLIIIAIGASAGVLIWQSKQDISHQIYLNARNYGELTAETIVDLTEQYLPSQSFVVFNPLMQDLLRKNEDIQSVQVYQFSGNLIFDSISESTEQYVGEPRLGVKENKNYVDRIQSQNPSIVTADGSIFYLDKRNDGTYQFVSRQGTRLEQLPDSREFKIKDIIFPVNNEFAVLYAVSYDNLVSRLNRAAINIGIVALLSILFSLMIGLYFAGKLTKPLAKLTHTVGLIAGGDLDQSVDVKANNEVGTLGNAVNQMAADLKKSIAAKIFKEKTEKELEIAKNIQQAILPKQLPSLETIDISAQLNSAEAVSGDVYDVIEVNNQNGHYVYAYLGDVTGHGIGASLLSSTANAMIAMLAPEEPNPVQLLAKVNNTLKAKTSGTVFITLALVKYDCKTQKITHVQAGHEPLLKYSAEAIEELPAGGIALGMLPDIAEQLVETTIELAEGESIILYSDGIPEAWKNEKEHWGMEALKKSYLKNGSLQTADAINKAILKDVTKYRNGFEQKDDMTLIVVKL